MKYGKTEEERLSAKLIESKNDRKRDYNRQRLLNWRMKNPDRHEALIQGHREDLKGWYHSIKAALSCSVCGESHPACLDFHHKDPAEKSANIARLISSGWSKSRIQTEMDKCDILCANCHRKKHFTPAKEDPRQSLPALAPHKRGSIGEHEIHKRKSRFSEEVTYLWSERILEIDGEQLTIGQWADRYGKTKRQIYKRLDWGWTPERAVKQPIRVINPPSGVEQEGDE